MFQCGDRLPEIKISLRMCDRMANFINDVASGRSRASREADGVVVVGGGLAGLATAAALTRVAGVQRVTVLECSSAADFADEEAGAAAQLGPNGLRALRFFGGE